MASTDAELETSVSTAIAFPFPLLLILSLFASSGAILLAASTTFAPSFAKYSAIVAPIPLLAPVMTAVLSINFGNRQSLLFSYIIKGTFLILVRADNNYYPHCKR